jgi:hypothetical protein
MFQAEKPHPYREVGKALLQDIFFFCAKRFFILLRLIFRSAPNDFTTYGRTDTCNNLTKS